LLCLSRVRSRQASFLFLLVNDQTQKLLVVDHLVSASLRLLWVMLISSGFILNILRYLKCIYCRLYDILSGAGPNRSRPPLYSLLLLLLLASSHLFWGRLIFLIHLLNHINLFVLNLCLICKAVIYYESGLVNIQMMSRRDLGACNCVLRITNVGRRSPRVLDRLGRVWQLMWALRLFARDCSLLQVLILFPNLIVKSTFLSWRQFLIFGQ
jgi:hypothetical protein